MQLVTVNGMLHFPAGLNMGWFFIGFNKGIKFCYGYLSIPAWIIVSEVRLDDPENRSHLCHF